MDELLDMPSDVERGARVKVGRNTVTEFRHEPGESLTHTVVSSFWQDLLVDCFKPTEVSSAPFSSTLLAVFTLLFFAE